MLRKIFMREDDSALGIRERLIRKISFFGIIIAIASSFEVLFAQNTYLALFPIGILVIMLVIAHVLSYKYNKHNAAAVIIGCAAVFFAFPSIFFLSGGVSGGATIWFVLGIFYSIGMFHGPMMVMSTLLTIIVDLGCYYVGYKHPEYIVPLNDYEAYLDSFIGVLFVGILLGVVTKYQINAYEKERITALEQKNELEKLSNSKSDFFANMSHEIRTPINAITGLDEMILREKNLSPEIRENAVTIQNAGKMLLSLVNDILDLSKIENRKMQILPIEYNTMDMFTELVEMIQPRIKEKELEFVVNIDRQIPSVLFGDDKRLQQIILNLLTNAVKYTQKGRVTLEAHIDKIGEEWCKLTVSVIDTGIGIKSENFEDLFDSFSRVNNADNRYIEGTGLGLSISKQLIELMGGQITVDSIYTKGSTFTIMLEQKIIDGTPIGSNELSRRNKDAVESYQQLFEAPEASVLVVDDNEMNRMVIQKLLASTKVDIDTAQSGQECLEMCNNKYYHVILMDYMMPKMDGAATLRQIRKQENGLCRDTPVVVLTGDTLLQQKSVFTAKGFDDYLEKPVKGEKLEETILKFLPDEVIEYRLYKNTVLSRISSGIVTEEYKRIRKKVVITTDCISDITDEFLEKYDISQVYTYINMKNVRFKDTKEIDLDNINMLNGMNVDIKAEAAPVEEYESFFAERLTYAEEVVHISLGKTMGMSYSNAVRAAKGFGHVKVIDSGNFSCGMALIVLFAAREVMLGATVEEVCEKVNEMKKNINSSFMMNSVDAYFKNKYTNNIYRIICMVLGGHPVVKAVHESLRITEVKVGNISVCRRHFLRRNLLKNKNVNGDIVYITHAGISVEEQERVLNEVKSYHKFKQIVVQKSCVTNACFSGKGTVGIAVYVEK